MTELILFGLAVGAALFIAQPFFGTGRGSRTEESENERNAQLEVRKQTLLEAIKELEFDYRMGKLSEEDFEEMNRVYREEAVAVLRQMDRSGEGEAESELEAEIRRLRRAKRVAGQRSR